MIIDITTSELGCTIDFKVTELAYLLTSATVNVVVLMLVAACVLRFLGFCANALTDPRERRKNPMHPRPPVPPAPPRRGYTPAPYPTTPSGSPPGAE